jgi:hypothetical protein
LYFKDQGLLQNDVYHKFYYTLKDGQLMILILYVDDLLITRNHMTQIKWIMSQLETKFELINLGYLNFYLGVEFLSVNKSIFMCQKDYTWRILEQFHMSDYNLAQTPLSNGSKLEKEEASKLVYPTNFCQIVGKLIYLTNTHLHNLFTISIISQYMSAPHKVHLEATKHMLRYIKGIQEFEIFYEVGDSNGLCGFTNADWTGDCEE